MGYMEEVEIQYEKCDVSYHSKKRNPTSIEDVLEFLLDNTHKIWWWSWEFVGQEKRNGGRLSHRAPARASDLALHMPEFVEDRRVGRFKVYRIRLENKEKVLKFLEKI